jgi:hypothetical protein
MTTGISYEQWLRNRAAGRGILCGPPIHDTPAWWQGLFPFLKPPAIRALERQARETERQAEAG